MFKGGKNLSALRQKRPLVHHITNSVTIADCADVTMSIGALPVMAHAPDEVPEMAGTADAAVINTGTLYPFQVRSMLELGRIAAERGIPAVLDPVGAGATSYRTATARMLIKEANIPIIKGNAAEIGILAGVRAVKISGVQSLDGGADPLESARRLAASTSQQQPVVAVSGPVDVVTDGERVARIHNGHFLLPLVVGSGCMAASLVAAFAAVEGDFFYAAVAALAAIGVAGEIAAAVKEVSLGPALFKVRLLDALYHLTPDELDRRAKVEIQ